MSIRFNCSTCQSHIKAPDTAAGLRVRCPKCQAVMVVPAPEPVAVATPVPASPTRSAVAATASHARHANHQREVPPAIARQPIQSESLPHPTGNTTKFPLLPVVLSRIVGTLSGLHGILAMLGIMGSNGKLPPQFLILVALSALVFLVAATMLWFNSYRLTQVSARWTVRGFAIVFALLIALDLVATTGVLRELDRPTSKSYTDPAQTVAQVLFLVKFVGDVLFMVTTGALLVTLLPPYSVESKPVPAPSTLTHPANKSEPLGTQR